MMMECKDNKTGMPSPCPGEGTQQKFIVRKPGLDDEGNPITDILCPIMEDGTIKWEECFDRGADY